MNSSGGLSGLYFVSLRASNVIGAVLDDRATYRDHTTKRHCVQALMKYVCCEKPLMPPSPEQSVVFFKYVFILGLIILDV